MNFLVTLVAGIAWYKCESDTDLNRARQTPCETFQRNTPRNEGQAGMNGDVFSIKAPKECSKKFVATLRGKFLTRGNVLRIFFLFLEDFGAPLFRDGETTIKIKCSFLRGRGGLGAERKIV